MITYIILVSTAIISSLSFKNYNFSSNLDFNPYRIFRKKEYYRFLSHTFVHADWVHLIINMLVFLSFGQYVERSFMQLESQNIIISSEISYILLYFGGAVIASVRSYFKHKNDPWYKAVGASGAVSAILFTSIFLSPLDKVYFYGIIPIPGILFGVLYLFYSSYMGKKAKDNINHDAHFWGAIYGFAFPIILDPKLLGRFVDFFI